MSWLLGSREGLLTLAFFLGFFGAGLAETFAPRRRQAPELGRRWIANLTLAALNATLAASLLPRVVVPVLAPAQALWTGLAAINAALALAVAILALDLIRYWIHRAAHAWPPLWRLHAVHHADHDVDVTTSYRHHPLEYLITGAALAAAHGVFGVPPLALAVYAALTLLWTPLAHANLRPLARFERVLAVGLVTPLFHARHHARERADSDANYGMVFSIWDRMFGTTAASDGDPVAFGIADVDNRQSVDIVAMLLLPLRREADRGRSSAAGATD